MDRTHRRKHNRRHPHIQHTHKHTAQTLRHRRRTRHRTRKQMAATAIRPTTHHTPRNRNRPHGENSPRTQPIHTPRRHTDISIRTNSTHNSTTRRTTHTHTHTNPKHRHTDNTIHKPTQRLPLRTRKTPKHKKPTSRNFLAKKPIKNLQK